MVNILGVLCVLGTALISFLSALCHYKRPILSAWLSYFFKGVLLLAFAFPVATNYVNKHMGKTLLAPWEKPLFAVNAVLVAGWFISSIFLSSEWVKKNHPKKNIVVNACASAILGYIFVSVSGVVLLGVCLSV